MKEYVDYRDGGYWVMGSRVSLDSIVYAFWNGQTPESITQSFSVLNLEQVYGAITYYLANRATIDQYIEKSDAEYEAMRQASREKDPMFYQKMAELKRQRRHKNNIIVLNHAPQKEK